MTAGTLLAHPTVDSFRIRVDEVHADRVRARILHVTTGQPTTISREWTLAGLEDWHLIVDRDPGDECTCAACQG